MFLLHFQVFTGQKQYLKLNIFDFKGMSTIPEVLVACHCGISVFAFSLITNECIMEEECSDEIEHEKVLAMANQRQDQMRTFVSKMIIGIDQMIGN